MNETRLTDRDIGGIRRSLGWRPSAVLLQRSPPTSTTRQHRPIIGTGLARSSTVTASWAAVLAATVVALLGLLGRRRSTET
jgi:hypothetical protein